MQFDTGPALEALGRPTFKHEGLTYEGRLISLPEWMHHIKDAELAEKNQLNLMQRAVVYRRLIDAWFPPTFEKKRRSFRRRRRAFMVGVNENGETETSRYRSVADIILELPVAIQSEAVGSFFHSQARAFALKREPSTAASTP